MTRNEMLARYDELKASDIYAVGFEYSNQLYVTMTKELRDDCVKLDSASTAKGSYAKLRIKLNARIKAMLVATKKAVCWGSIELIDYKDQYNRGDHFEKVVVERLTKTEWHKNSTPFYVAGDLEWNGQQVQVKFDGAELTNEKTLSGILA